MIGLSHLQERKREELLGITAFVSSTNAVIIGLKLTDIDCALHTKHNNQLATVMRLITNLAATLVPGNMLTVSMNAEKPKTLYAKEAKPKGTKFEDIKRAQMQARRMN